MHTIQGTGAQSTLAVSADGSARRGRARGQAIARVFGAGSGAPSRPCSSRARLPLAFSPNGELSRHDRTRNGFVWDTHTWKQLHIAQRSRGIDSDDVGFAPDGRVVTGSTDSSRARLGSATGELALHARRAAPAEGARRRGQPGREGDRDRERGSDGARLECPARLHATGARRPHRLRHRRGLQPGRIASPHARARTERRGSGARPCRRSGSSEPTRSRSAGSPTTRPESSC